MTDLTFNAAVFTPLLGETISHCIDPTTGRLPQYSRLYRHIDANDYDAETNARPSGHIKTISIS